MRVEPLQSGGGQERGMRSGTLPAPLVVGLGAACEISQQEMEVFFFNLPCASCTFTSMKLLHKIYHLCYKLCNL